MNTIIFFRRIKLLNTGIKRLLLVLGVVISIFLGPILTHLPFYIYFHFDEDTLPMLIAAILCFSGFWIIVRVILWIIDGFYK